MIKRYCAIDMARLSFGVALAALVAYALVVSAAAQVPLSNGIMVSGTVSAFSFQNYTFSVPYDGAVVTVTVSTSSGVVYTFGAFNTFPTFFQNDWADTSQNGVKSWNVPTASRGGSKVIFSVYGFNPSGSSVYSIVCTIVDVYLEPGAISTGSLAAGTKKLFKFSVPPNVFNMQIYVDSKTGDPDQYIGYGFISAPVTSQQPTYSNTSAGFDSCITVVLPPAGDYYYILLAYGNNGYNLNNYRTQVVYNNPGSCAIASHAQLAKLSLPKPIIPEKTPPKIHKDDRS